MDAIVYNASLVTLSIGSATSMVGSEQGLRQACNPGLSTSSHRQLPHRNCSQPALPVESHVPQNVELVPGNRRGQILLHLLRCCPGC